MRPRHQTLEDLYLFGSAELKSNQISNYKKESEWIILHILKKNSSWFHSNKNYLFNQYEINYFNDCINKRKDHIPLQIILGKSTFYGRDFILFPDVFVPRPETELIIEILAKESYKKALDICSGSGVLGITLYLEGIVSTVDAVDISTVCIENIRANATYLQCSDAVTSNHLDIMAQKPDSKYDIIVCNPPYIKYNDIASLPHDVQHYDPIDALTDFHDGLSFYRRLKNILSSLLVDEGVLLIEFGGHIQVDALKSIFSKQRLTVYKDFNNYPRIMKITS